jgi:hypothetical protein
MPRDQRDASLQPYSLKINRVELSLPQGVEARRIMRRRGSHLSYTIGSEMAVRSVLRAVRSPLTPTKLPATVPFY